MYYIKGENCKMWINEHEGKNGKWYTYAVSVSRKDENGDYQRKSVRLVIPKSVHVPNGLKSGTAIDFEGFPSIDIYTGKDGQEHREIMFVAQKVKFREVDVYDSFEQLDEDMPFN